MAHFAGQKLAASSACLRPVTLTKVPNISAGKNRRSYAQSWRRNPDMCWIARGPKSNLVLAPRWRCGSGQACSSESWRTLYKGR